MNTTAMLILRALEILPLVIAQGGTAMISWQASVAKIKLMVQENRDPTPEEWDTLNGDLDALQSALHTD